MRIVFINVKKGISKLGCWVAPIPTTLVHEDDLVSVDELPRTIKIYDSNIDINIELQNLPEGVASQVEPFSQDIVNASDVCRQGYLIFICSYTIAVIPSFGTNGDLSSYFFFDARSRSDHGITICTTYFSVLLQFPNLCQIEKYLELAYEIANRSFPVYFQFQYLNVNISEKDFTYIQDSFRKERKKSEKQNMRLEEHFSKFGNHEVIKGKIKQQLRELN